MAVPQRYNAFSWKFPTLIDRNEKKSSTSRPENLQKWLDRPNFKAEPTINDLDLTVALLYTCVKYNVRIASQLLVLVYYLISRARFMSEKRARLIDDSVLRFHSRLCLLGILLIVKFFKIWNPKTPYEMLYQKEDSSQANYLNNILGDKRQQILSAILRKYGQTVMWPDVLIGDPSSGQN